MLLSLCILFCPTEVNEVDIWEINHVICQQTGAIVLDQVVLWDFNLWHHQPNYHVVAWVLTPKASKPEKLKGRWIGRIDGHAVSARVVIETWTTVDWEIEDRKEFPIELRRGLK